MTEPLLERARSGDAEAFADLVAPLRPGLLLHCYRMLASSHDAEDAVQETLLRAWRGLGRFEGRSAVRTWLYSVATNVCLREIERRGRRLLPVDLGGAGDVTLGVSAPATEVLWLGPLPDAGLDWSSSPTEAVYEQREAVELAFIAALQRLPALQRAVLVLRDVLAFSAAETATILETTVDAVTSALARARGSLRAELPERSQQRVLREVGDQQVRATVSAFLAAWERADVDAVVALLADDVALAMPPFPEWFRGRADVAAFLADYPLRPGRRWRGFATTASGQPAVDLHVWDESLGAYVAHSVTLLTLGEDGAIRAIDSFHDASLVGPRPA